MASTLLSSFAFCPAWKKKKIQKICYHWWSQTHTLVRKSLTPNPEAIRSRMPLTNQIQTVESEEEGLVGLAAPQGVRSSAEFPEIVQRPTQVVLCTLRGEQGGVVNGGRGHRLIGLDTIGQFNRPEDSNGMSLSRSLRLQVCGSCAPGLSKPHTSKLGHSLSARALAYRTILRWL